MTVSHRTARTAALAVATIAALPAAAQDAMRWQQRQAGGALHLAYEVPETSDQGLLLTCETRDRRFAVRYRDDRDRVRDGSQAVVEFASEGGRLPLRMRAERQELGDQIVLIATQPLTPDLVRILRGATLRVTLSGVTERIPLAPAQPGVAALARDCGGG